MSVDTARYQYRSKTNADLMRELATKSLTVVTPDEYDQILFDAIARNIGHTSRIEVVRWVKKNYRVESRKVGA